MLPAMAADPVRFSRVQPLVHAHPRPGADHRGHPPGADHRRVRGASWTRPGIRGCGPASTSPPSGACRSRPSPSPSRSTSPGPTSPRCTPSGSGTSRAFDRADILRYLRHEMGHVVNYAYRLYDDEEWVKQFGSITQPYVEEYRPEPFSRRYVRHLPGLVRPEAPRRGLGRDLRRVDDAGPRLAGASTPAGRWPRPSWRYCDRTMARARATAIRS